MPAGRQTNMAVRRENVFFELLNIELNEKPSRFEQNHESTLHSNIYHSLLILLGNVLQVLAGYYGLAGKKLPQHTVHSRESKYVIFVIPYTEDIN